jgi:hypothetical protein
MPAMNGRRIFSGCNFNPTPPEISQTAANARPNPINVPNPGRPSEKAPTRTGIAAATSAEMGAAMLICPEASALYNKANPTPPPTPAAHPHNKSRAGGKGSPVMVPNAKSKVKLNACAAITAPYGLVRFTAIPPLKSPAPQVTADIKPKSTAENSTLPFLSVSLVQNVNLLQAHNLFNEYFLPVNYQGIHNKNQSSPPKI